MDPYPNLANVLPELIMFTNLKEFISKCAVQNQQAMAHMPRLQCMSLPCYVH